MPKPRTDKPTLALCEAVQDEDWRRDWPAGTNPNPANPRHVLAAAGTWKAAAYYIILRRRSDTIAAGVDVVARVVAAADCLVQACFTSGLGGGSATALREADGIWRAAWAPLFADWYCGLPPSKQRKQLSLSPEDFLLQGANLEDAERSPLVDTLRAGLHVVENLIAWAAAQERAASTAPTKAKPRPGHGSGPTDWQRATALAYEQTGKTQADLADYLTRTAPRGRGKAVTQSDVSRAVKAVNEDRREKGLPTIETRRAGPARHITLGNIGRGKRTDGRRPTPRDIESADENGSG